MTVAVLAFVVGVFLFLARFRFFWDPSKAPGSRWFNRERYDSLHRKMVFCGWGVGTAFWVWFAATVEVVGGAMFALGIARPYVGPVILGVLLGATKCTACYKVAEQNPVDSLDVACAYLWRVEGLYIVMTGLVVWADWVEPVAYLSP